MSEINISKLKIFSSKKQLQQEYLPPAVIPDRYVSVIQKIKKWGIDTIPLILTPQKKRYL